MNYVKSLMCVEARIYPLSNNVLNPILEEVT